MSEWERRFSRGSGGRQAGAKGPTASSRGNWRWCARDLRARWGQGRWRRSAVGETGSEQAGSPELPGSPHESRVSLHGGSWGPEEVGRTASLSVTVPKDMALRPANFCLDGHGIYTVGSTRTPHRLGVHALQPKPGLDAPEAPQLRARRDRTSDGLFDQFRARPRTKPIKPAPAPNRKG